MDLSNAEIRVLGCLLEKRRTTPDPSPRETQSTEPDWSEEVVQAA